MRIISWNIQWGRGADGKVDLDRTLATLKAMGGAELICLQEVAQNVTGLAGGDVGDQPALFAAAFPDHEGVYAPGVDVPAPGGGRARFGNLMLSSLPLQQVVRHMLPYPADPALPGMQRSCIEAVVLGPNGPIRMLTTHLEYYSSRQRRSQVEALRAIQEEAVGHAESPPVPMAKERNPVFARRVRPASAVLCGDFNCKPGSAEYDLLGMPAHTRGAGWRDAWPIAHTNQPHAPTVGLHGADWPDQPYCCDFFWVSEDLTSRVMTLQVEAETSASDHQPLLLELSD